MERCAVTPASQAFGFTEQINNGTEGTNGGPSGVASRVDDDPDDARWKEVKRVQAARREWAKRLGMSDDDVQVFIDNITKINNCPSMRISNYYSA